MAASLDHQFIIVDLQNTFIPPRLFKWEGQILIDIAFVNENQFYSVGKDHFDFWTVDSLKPKQVA